MNKVEQKDQDILFSFSLQLLHLLLYSASYQSLGCTKGPSSGDKDRMSCVTLKQAAKPVGHFVSAVRTKETQPDNPPCSWLLQPLNGLWFGLKNRVIQYVKISPTLDNITLSIWSVADQMDNKFVFP